MESTPLLWFGNPNWDFTNCITIDAIAIILGFISCDPLPEPASGNASQTCE